MGRNILEQEYSDESVREYWRQAEQLEEEADEFAEADGNSGDVPDLSQPISAARINAKARYLLEEF